MYFTFWRSAFSYQLEVCLSLVSPHIFQAMIRLSKILFIKFKINYSKNSNMQNFIQLQNVLTDPKKSFEDFKSQFFKSEISQFTYICLLLNIAATVKRPNFNFQPYLDLLSNFKKEPGYRSSCVNYTGYKDKISILMNACEKSISSTVSILASHPDIKLHCVDPNGFNAVFYAIKNPDQNEGLKILQLLKDQSSEMIDTVSNNGFSPLFLAVDKFRVKIVEFLLKNQTDPNQKLISSGNSAMHELVKISSRYCLDQVKKMIQVFLRYGFDLNIRNNMQKTVQQYAFDLRFNVTDIINELKFSKNNQEFGFYSEQSQTEAYSSKRATTRLGDVFTNCNYSQIEGSEFNQIDALSVSSKSLLSQVNYYRHNEERQKQFSVDMNANQSIYDGQIQDLELDEVQRKMECLSHSDSPKSDFSLSQDEKIQRQGSVKSFGSSSSQNSQSEFLKVDEIDFQRIQKEALQFDQISHEIYLSAWRQIQPFFMKLNQITESLGLVIELIGSFATGLWTHHSDIDIALVTFNQNFINFQILLQKVYGKLKFKMYDMGIKQLCYNKASKVPSIKLEMDPYLFSSRKIDIMIFHKKNMGVTYVNYIRQAVIQFNSIRPLFFFLKRVCEEFGLHDPFKGGMKSYSIFLMIFSMVKSLDSRNLGQILLKIALYYGFYHEYDYDMQYHKKGQSQKQFIPVLRLNIMDPLNTKNNMGGKNTDTYKVRNMFRTIYYGLHKKISKGSTSLQYILELAPVIV